MAKNNYGKIVLEADKVYALPIKNGHLDIRVSTDPNYPGLDIEYISDKEDDIPNEEFRTRPRVLIENNENVLRAFVWSNPYEEDYTDDIYFTCIEDSEPREITERMGVMTETVKMWQEQFVLTGKDVVEEIDNIKGTISNERLWVKGSATTEAAAMHEENIRELTEYLRWLHTNMIEKKVLAYESGKMLRPDSEVEIDLINKDIWLFDYNPSRGSAEAIEKLCDEDEIDIDELIGLCEKHDWAYAL